MRKTFIVAITGIVALASFVVSRVVPVTRGAFQPPPAPPGAGDGVQTLLAIGLSVVGVLAVALTVELFRTRERALRAEALSAALRDTHDDRFDRVERAIESVALEVERIGEAERFATKMIAARQLEAVRPNAGRVITPH